MSGVPNVGVKKATVGASPAVNSPLGVLAIIATASAGPLLTPTMCTQQAQLTSSFTSGPLPEYGTYCVDVSGRPVVAMRSSGSVAATYGTFVKTGTGTYTPTAGATAPLEHYAVIVNWIAGTTAVGTAGATYVWSADGGGTFSTTQALGTNTSIVLGSTGITVNLGTGTIVAGDTLTFFTERALLSNTDVSAALTALGNTRMPWEAVLVDCEYISGSDPISILDVWLQGREAKGQFNWAAVNTRYLLEPTPNTETPSAYATAMATLTGSDASNRIAVGADGGHVVSLITGFNLKRPTALALCSMAMALTPNIGTDPSAVEDAGSVPGYAINVGGAPNDWDEDVYGGTSGLLDPLRLVTLRTFAPGGPQGVYITNANILAPSSSNIIWLQLLRCLNAACTVSWQTLNTQLSKGVNTIISSTTGQPVIDPSDAQAIEAVVNGPLAQALSGQVTNQKFALNRDDILATPGAPVTANVSIVPKFYLKSIQVTVALVKQISVPLGGA